MLRESGTSPCENVSGYTYEGHLREVRRFAEDVVAPKVREMDESEMMDKSVIKGLFEQGVRPSRSPCQSAY